MSVCPGFQTKGQLSSAPAIRGQADGLHRRSDDLTVAARQLEMQADADPPVDSSAMLAALNRQRAAFTAELPVSIETRKEVGETYSSIAGFQTRASRSS